MGVSSSSRGEKRTLEVRLVDGLEVLLLVCCMGENGGRREEKSSFSSSSQISWVSVIVALRRRPMVRWPLSCGDSLSRSAVSSSVMGVVVVVSESEISSSSTNPMPGVRGFWATGGRVVGSLFRRQERARTPVRRTTVPRAIFRKILAGLPGSVSLCDLLVRHEAKKVVSSGRNR